MASTRRQSCRLWVKVLNFFLFLSISSSRISLFPCYPLSLVCVTALDLRLRVSLLCLRRVRAHEAMEEPCTRGMEEPWRAHARDSTRILYRFIGYLTPLRPALATGRRLFVAVRSRDSSPPSRRGPRSRLDTALPLLPRALASSPPDVDALTVDGEGVFRLVSWTLRCSGDRSDEDRDDVGAESTIYRMSHCEGGSVGLCSCRSLP